MIELVCQVFQTSRDGFNVCCLLNTHVISFIGIRVDRYFKIYGNTLKKTHFEGAINMNAYGAMQPYMRAACRAGQR
jgi:hypothetical protein